MSRGGLVKPWWRMPVVFYDVETTGLDPATEAIVQVAAALFDGGELVRSASSLANPGSAIPAEATAIHGITDTMVAGAPEPQMALCHVTDQVLLGYGAPESAWGAAYNATFDRAFILQTNSEHLVDHPSLDPDGPPWIDPLVVVRTVGKFWPGKGRHKLTSVCERFGIPLDNAHDAESDAVAAGRVMYSPAIREALGDMTLCELLRRQEVRRIEQEADFQVWLAKQPPLPEDAREASQ